MNTKTGPAKVNYSTSLQKPRKDKNGGLLLMGESCYHTPTPKNLSFSNFVFWLFNLNVEWKTKLQFYTLKQ